MAYTNPAHHPAGYNYPSQPQLFSVEENGWGGQGWVAPSVCVAHFLFIRACTLTDFAESHAFNGDNEPLYRAWALRVG